MQRVWGEASSKNREALATTIFEMQEWNSCDTHTTEWAWGFFIHWHGVKLMLKRNRDNLSWLIIANNKGTLSKHNDIKEKMNLGR